MRSVEACVVTCEADHHPGHCAGDWTSERGGGAERRDTSSLRPPQTGDNTQVGGHAQIWLGLAKSLQNLDKLQPNWKTLGKIA